MKKINCTVRVLGAACLFALASCGGGGDSIPTVPDPIQVPSTLALPSGQVITGQIDLNGGAQSHINPLTVVATGGKIISGYSWTTTPGRALPHPAIFISATQGVITGRSTTLQRGVFTMFVDVNDDSGVVRSGQVTIDLNSTCNSNPAAFNPCTFAQISTVHDGNYLPKGKIGAEYAATIVTGGGQPPYSWSLVEGTNLPPGIVIDQARGVFRGTPTAAGIYQPYIRVTDAAGTTSREAGLMGGRFHFVINS